MTKEKTFTRTPIFCFRSVNNQKRASEIQRKEALARFLNTSPPQNEPSRNIKEIELVSLSLLIDLLLN